ncbi:DUF4030 domain-containing protein [Aquibacillus kalidii]|uniref:DUF4030 domain-containing protein n=1 Tax=Aquibacillus kalidii TaxID=2762597 RepID=UPI0016489A05|nr:DUF4030 domain-containing protein [Aquibacillus kalidii]
MKNKWEYPEEIKKQRFTKLHQRKVLSQLDNTQPKSRKRSVIRGLTVAAILMMLLGSAFFIPSVENVVAKIPYISKFLEEKELSLKEQDRLGEKVLPIIAANGLRIGGLEFNMEDKEMLVGVIGSSGNVREMSNQIQNQLHNMELNGFDVTLVPLEEEKEVQTERSRAEIKKGQQDSKELTTSLTKRIEAEGYELMYPIQVRINNIEGVYMNVIVPESESRLDKLKEIIREEASAYGDELTVDVRQIQNKALEQEKRWKRTGAISNIGEALMETKHYPVTGFAFSFHPYPLQIIIKTSLNAKNPDASDIADEIRSEVDLYIESSEETRTIRNDQYKVIVEGQDHKEIE